MTVSKGKTLFFIMIIIMLTSCGKKFMFKEADKAIKSLSIEDKIGQLLMVAVPGAKMNKISKEIIEKYKPGGIILFGYNIENSKKGQKLRQLKKYLNDFQKISSVPLFVSIDQEGGRVMRITSGVEQFPGNMAAGAGGDNELVEQWGSIIGLQLRLLGINMNLAPVVDVNNNPVNPVINIRSFGAETSLVSRLGASYIKGLQKSRCIAVAKHFPGHGDTNKDSHVTLPVIKYKRSRLNSIEFPPFNKAISEGVDGIMTAHIAYPGILKNYEPATVSSYFLTTVLRKEMNFKGLVITDDMEMHAISRRKKMDGAAIDAIKAGADIILVSSYGNNIEKIYNGIKKAVENGIISQERLDQSIRKILEVKIRYNLMNLVEKKGEMKEGTFSLLKDDKKILHNAGEVNRKLSEKALYYRGDEKLMKKKLHIITYSGTIARELKNSSVKRWTSLNACLNFIKRNGKEKDSVVVYHMNIPQPGKALAIMKILRQRKINGILLLTGNPFPIISRKVAKNYLFTFSPTRESLKAAARCLKGEIPYKNKLGFSLGFKN